VHTHDHDQIVQVLTGAVVIAGVTVVAGATHVIAAGLSHQIVGDVKNTVFLNLHLPK
jgi:hypothetical protein